jgi:ABC-type glycerol-3-phosphate transport system permease component
MEVAAATGTTTRRKAADARRKLGWGAANTVTIVIVAIPLLWILSLSFKAPGAMSDPSFWPAQWTWGNYSGILKTSQFIRPLFNSIGIGLISTVIAVTLASMPPTRSRRRRAGRLTAAEVPTGCCPRDP